MAGRCMRLYRYYLLLLIIPLWTTISLAADSTATNDYSFDTTALAVKPFDASASLEFYPYLFCYNKASPLYSLKFGQENRTYADIYNLKTEAYLHYHRKSFIAFTSGALYGAYLRQDDSISYDAKLFEGYFKYTPVPSLSFLVGKRLFQWGKGYSFNPVSFAGRVKDLNNMDATLEGYWNISIDYVRSFNSPVSSVAFNAVFLPVYNVINRDFLPDKSVAGLAQFYMLLANTDIDIYLFGDSRENLKTGLDFSRNIIPDWEIHGEWAYTKSSNSTAFSNESTIVTQSRPANNIVAGTRYLAPFNTTFILEYLHIGSGHAQDEMDAYYQAADNARASSEPRRINAVLQAASWYYNSQCISTDYLFIKAIHPDPFNFVYFTPSLYAIISLLDRSMMAGFEMSYNRSRNLFFTARYIAFVGNNESEYGLKPARHRIDLRAKWSF
jgi:hypothetical protein